MNNISCGLDMRQIGTITIHCEDFGQLPEPPISAAPLSPVAITLEGTPSPRGEQIEVCKAIKQACHKVHRRFYLCGVTPGNRGPLADAGLLDGLGPREIHDSISTLLQSFSNSSPPRPPRSAAGRSPNIAGPTATTGAGRGP